MKGSGKDEGVGADDEQSAAPGPEASAPSASAKAERRAAKAEAKAARRAEKAARKAAKAHAKAAKRALKEASERAKAARKDAARTARREAKRAKAEARAARRAAKSDAKVDKDTVDGPATMPDESVSAPSAIPASTRALLEEAADLMHQAEAPAAQRIVERVADRAATAGVPPPAEVPMAEADTGPEPVALVEPAPEAEPPVAPEPEPEAAPEPEPASAEPETEVAPEPEPASAEPEHEAAPEPEPPSAEPASTPALELEAGEAPAALLAPEVDAPRAVVPEGALIAASIDVGSTSVHLLVGIVDGHRITPLQDESVFLGLGDRVASEGYLGVEARDALAADLDRYVAAARALGATTITIVATEPLRRAEDAPTAVRMVEQRTGVPVHVLDHGEEGLLTFLGVTGGTPVSGELLLVDIGGGSSEFVDIGADGRVHTLGLRLGANRLTRELVRSDPPSLADIDALRVEVSRQMAGAPDARPTEIVAVGGTASNLLRLLPATAVDRALTRRRVAVALAMLTVERSTEAAARHLIRPERARILPAGAIIVDAILERYGADRLRVSEAGIREGAILAAAHGGAAWRDRLSAMARGWVEPA